MGKTTLKGLKSALDGMRAGGLALSDVPRALSLASELKELLERAASNRPPYAIGARVEVDFGDDGFAAGWPLLAPHGRCGLGDGVDSAHAAGASFPRPWGPS